MRFWRGFFCALMLIGTAKQAGAALIINVFESGNNVVATATGSLNLMGLSRGQSTGTPGVIPNIGTLLLGVSGSTNVYIGASGPTSLGPGGFTTVSSFSGILVGVGPSSAGPPLIWTDRSYASGLPINSTAQWNNRTINSLGLTPGQYVYTLPADSLTINVGEIPEPSSIGLMALGSLAILYRLRKRS
jgi:hypothetical protein